MIWKKLNNMGINSFIGASGEKYISFDKSRNRYSVIITTHKKKPKQLKVGHYKTLKEAVIVRDNFLNK